MSAPAAVLISVGDELLLGKTVDTNAAWLGRELGTLGFRVVRAYSVRDDAAEIRGAVSEALEAGELVVLTGGLGPTMDDVTREAVAGLLDRPLHLNEELLEDLTRRFRERGFDELPPRNRSQAEVPEGAGVLANPRGTAPGLYLEAPGGRRVALLPGPPREMEGVSEGALLTRLREDFADRLEPVHHHTIHTTGIAESVLAERVEEALPEDTSPVSVAFLPDVRGVDLRLTVRGVSEEEARKRVREILDRLEPVVGPHSFPAESGDLVEAVARALEGSGRTLAVAESCTGGLIAKRLTDRPGASAYFLGGVVAYGDRVKQEVLGVDTQVLARVGAVSEEVARAMATGAARRLGADVGVGITGIAGPEGGTEEKPVGTVWYAVAVNGETAARVERFVGDREQIRERSAQAALALLLRRLAEETA